ncbi:hypothetical protein AQ505_06320 [Pedobacter sp. PACM 27299]|uniref:DUF417 family protein n=1 Tax=Pedobacter sp. PACM 27299 TaxID=1727164 RepID=UPI000706429E|nr:DUF417 family protein [Pedobacter sp. PACM 27299]ALL05142.1 hypothetical protein AQ505_06320 [Pedobacter sp. PACM 27299]
MSGQFTTLLQTLAGLSSLSIRLIRIAIAIVLIWIGGLKVYHYEAEGIVPFVANSALMSFFYADPTGYKPYMQKEGEANPEKIAWHSANHTYLFSYGLGTVLVLMGITLLLNHYHPGIGMAGAALVILMSVVTLSFLISTKESWVPDLGDPNHGFPLLSARGRLVIKDLIMMAGAFTALCDSARQYLIRNKQPVNL